MFVLFQVRILLNVLFDELCKQNLLFLFLPIWVFMSLLMIRTLCLRMLYPISFAIFLVLYRTQAILECIVHAAWSVLLCIDDPQYIGKILILAILFPDELSYQSLRAQSALLLYTCVCVCVCVCVREREDSVDTVSMMLDDCQFLAYVIVKPSYIYNVLSPISRTISL